MPYRPLISKIRCNNPNLKKSQIRNRNHLIYIGTREGVDLSAPDLEKCYSEDTENLMFNQASSDELYIKYIAERPGSNGLWGNADTSDIKKLGNELSMLTSQGKNIYRGIISLSEPDAIQLGFTEKNAWENYINSVMPDIAKELGIPFSSMKYAAAFHKEKGHPHCHYMLWDTSSKITSAYIHPSVQNRIREFLSGEMFQAERSQEIINKTLKRDLILDLGKEAITPNLSRQLDETKENLSGNFSTEELKKISQKIVALSHSLPDHGRLNYQFLSPDTKNLVDETVDYVLNTYIMKKEYLEYLHTADLISKTYSPSSNHHSRNILTADQDIKKRIANQILKSCKKIISIENDFQQHINTKADSAETNSFIDNASSDKQREPFFDIADTDIDKLNLFWNTEYKTALSLLYEKNQPEEAYTILMQQAKQNNLLAYEVLAKMHAQRLIKNASSAMADHLYSISFKGYQKLLSEKPKSYYYYKIGKLYERGLGTTQNFDKALEYYRNAGEYKYAQFALGNMHLYHKGIEDTPEALTQAAQYFKLAADQHMPYAAYQYARILDKTASSKGESEKYYQDAFNGFIASLSSEASDDFLLYRIGTMYYEGKGTSPDPDMAYEFFCRSKAFGNVNADYALGKTYADCESKYYNPFEAEKCFLSAINKKFKPAYTELGKLYLDEQAPLYDPAKAIQYLELASRHGSSLSMCRLGSVYAQKATPFYDPNKALYWYNQSLSADPDNPYTMHKLGNFYLWSDKEFQNVGLGKQYLLRACELGNEAAMDSLNFYDNIQNQIAVSTAYSLLMRTFSSISSSKNQMSFEEMVIKSHSKENRKIETQKQKEEGR